MRTDVQTNTVSDVYHPNCKQQQQLSAKKVIVLNPNDSFTTSSKLVSITDPKENYLNQNAISKIAIRKSLPDRIDLNSPSNSEAINALKIAPDSKIEGFSDDGIHDLLSTEESLNTIKLTHDSKVNSFIDEGAYDLSDSQETLSKINLASDSKLELYEALDLNTQIDNQPSVAERGNHFSGEIPETRLSYRIASFLISQKDELFCADSGQTLRRYNSSSGYYEALPQKDFGYYLLNILPDNIVGATTQNVENEVYRFLLKCRKFSIRLPSMPEKLVNLANGVFDLDTGKLQRHSPSFGFTFGVEANFRDNQKMSETSERYFLNLGIDEKGKENILAMIGFSICNYRKLQKAAFMYGPGGNGKTICSKFIKRLLPPDMVAGLNFSDLANSFAPSNLENKMVSISTDEDTKKPTSKGISVFKKIVGGDFLEVQKKNIQHHTMESNCFLIFISNYQFKIKKSDDPNGGVKRRIWFIRTGERVGDIDPDLSEKLWADRDAIVSQALLTASRFMKNWQDLMPEPSDEELYEDSNSYGDIIDQLISRFVNTTFEYTGDQHDRIAVQEIYKAFCGLYSKEVSSLDIQLNGFASRLKKCVREGSIRKKKNQSTLCGYNWKAEEPDFDFWDMEVK